MTGTTLQGLQTAITRSPYGEPAEESATLPGGGEFTLVYERDAAGRLIKREEQTPSGPRTWDYSYDLSGRLGEVRKDGAPYANYSYDENGNRTQETIEGETTTAIFDARDRMKTQGNNTYAYNKNGELTGRANSSTGKSAAFTYDTFGNLTGASTEDGDQITYKLDADANRATREVDGELKSRYIYAEGIQGPVVELAGDNSVAARFVYTTRSIVPDYMEKAGKTYRLLTDQLGSVRLVVDAQSGEIAQEIEYDPFGKVISDSNKGFQPFGFAGGLYDSATGLTHFGAREYSAEMGRWTASDPISFAGGDGNLYGYVLADPVNFVDPSGLILGGIGDAVGGVAKLVYDNAGTIAQIGATTVCIVASAGACVAVAGALLAVNAASNLGDVLSGRQCLIGALGDFGRELGSTAVSTMPGARLAYAGDLAEYGVSRAGSYALKATVGVPGFGLGQSFSMAPSGNGCGC